MGLALAMMPLRLVLLLLELAMRKWVPQDTAALLPMRFLQLQLQERVLPELFASQLELLAPLQLLKLRAARAVRTRLALALLRPMLMLAVMLVMLVQGQGQILVTPVVKPATRLQLQLRLLLAEVLLALVASPLLSAPVSLALL